VIDLFAGPGGLGEGFGAHGGFRVALSVEKEESAHRTLRLRAFFRQFERGRAPEDYYRRMRGEITEEDLFARHSDAAAAAEREAWRAELGAATPGHGAVRERIAGALRERGMRSRHDPWILLGGPPCQPFSIAGRSRNRGIAGYTLEGDDRHRLYREYLRVIADHWPPVFVMENVKGLLSAKVNGVPLFERVLDDLSDPARAVRLPAAERQGFGYRLVSVSTPAPADFYAGDGLLVRDPRHYLVEAEKHGIPQMRHRVIILGLRSDLGPPRIDPLKEEQPVPVERVLDGLPRLRSGFSRLDFPDRWTEWLAKQAQSAWLARMKNNGSADVADRIMAVASTIRIPKRGLGAEFLPYEPTVGVQEEWYLDPKLGGVANHSARGHMATDLSRYVFAACFAQARKRSPELSDFPHELLPRHRSAAHPFDARVAFADRFRVQVRGRPCTTIVSHIAKDGHYYIHYDPSQCRSLTVREAARVQTFPDNYLFVGTRTKQYTQVGNAVPPLLAFKIAGLVRQVLEGAGMVA
jgi:DNA (cytosine-5)-methyltransferase 1